MGTRLIFGSVRHRVRATPFPKAWLHTRRAASNLGFIGLGNMGQGWSVAFYFGSEF